MYERRIKKKKKISKIYNKYVQVVSSFTYQLVIMYFRSVVKFCVIIGIIIRDEILF